jgi:hypothetical protein
MEDDRTGLEVKLHDQRPEQCLEHDEPERTDAAPQDATVVAVVAERQ